MGWRLARSLSVLRAEFDKVAPDRSKVSDGTIGDPAHGARCSRHNPNPAGVVCALDVTHDPAGGCDVHAIARRIAKAPHPELAYIISDGEVARRVNGFTWRKYLGSNPHTKHAHFAVGDGPDCKTGPTPPYDSLQPWGVAAPPAPPPPPLPGIPAVTKEDADMYRMDALEGPPGQCVVATPFPTVIVLGCNDYGVGGAPGDGAPIRAVWRKSGAWEPVFPNPAEPGAVFVDGAAGLVIVTPADVQSVVLTHLRRTSLPVHVAVYRAA